MLAAAATAPARADPRPLPFPTQDATIIYQTITARRPVTLTFRFRVSPREVRTDIGRVVTIVDITTGHVVLLRPAEHRYIELPGSVGRTMRNLGLPDESVTYRETGTDTIAGHTCTVWRAAVPEALSLCQTADGLNLRLAASRHGKAVAMVATRVTLAPLDPALFQPPPGYTRSEPPPEMLQALRRRQK
ncbi:MAG TPA: hypothetical protein VME92_04965 [Acetobacteraceae bacterium]|nr:hypothetical protein [Acetobacteraceae bacterium]